METSTLLKENLPKATSQLTTSTYSLLKTEKQSSNSLAEFSAFDATKDGNVSGKCSKHGTSKVSGSFEEKFKIEPDVEISELLGSVITHNCPGVRTSARVIQKMKQDQTRPTTPPPIERDHKQKEEKNVQKTPSQLRTNKPIWTNLERNHFFDAINEFGKDFEAIGNYINSKLRRKCGTDISFKTKEQVRLHYYQTFHKICKYIRFSDEVKKPAQEMYALINYGEMRRKLQFVTDKQFIKLRQLVYQGQIIVRCKGKNIRIKTPSCKALRKLNQLDDSLEDIRLPSKIEVIVTPANMEAFGRVQTIAQNPRARITVPLQKKLINFIKTFQHKWRSSDVKLAEEEAKFFPHTGSASSLCSEQNAQSADVQPNEKTLTAAASAVYQDPEMCFLPKPGVTIHRPLLSITEYLSSVNICLSAYEERMGVKVRGETLCLERPNNKRHRSESGSDKRSPDAKKQKNLISAERQDLAVNSISLLNTVTIKEEPSYTDPELLLVKCENTVNDYNGDDLNVELNELLSDADLTKDEHIKTTVGTQVKLEPAMSGAKQDVITSITINTNSPSSIVTTSCNIHTTTATITTTTTHARSKRGSTSKARSALTFKPLISDAVIKCIRKGWTISNAGDITIGDLYVVFGQDSRLEFDYYWTDAANATVLTSTNSCTAQTDSSSSIFLQKPNGVPYNPSECDDRNLTKTLLNSTVSNKLKHLLLIANLSERIRKRQCSCGHTCEKTIAKARIQQIERDLATKTFISNKTFLPNATSSDGNSLFRQPIVPIRRPVFNMDPMKQIPTVLRPKMSRQVLVQRLLLPGGMNHHDLVNDKTLQNNIIGLKQDKEKMMTSIQNTITHVNPSLSNYVRTKYLKPISPSKIKSESVIELPSNLKDDASCTDISISSTYVQQDTIEFLPLKLSDVGEHKDIYNEETAEDSVKNLNEFSVSSAPDSAFDETSNTSVFNGISPNHLIRESTSNSRWLEENLNDFSLTSLLGHLDEINANRDILDPSSNMSVISESSVDYMSKFEEITALMRSQEND